MRINSIEITNFRNHSSFKSELTSQTYITGSNGSGKTSIIEAIYLISALKSFRSRNIKDLRKFGEENFRVKVNAESNGRNFDLIYFYDSSRKLLMDKVPVKDFKDYVYHNPIICYSPEGNFILSKEQVYRRNFIDRLTFFLNTEHMSDLKDFKRLITQKYAMITKTGFDVDYLDIINGELVKISQKISKSRKQTVDRLNSEIYSLYNQCSFGDELYKIRYDTNTENFDIFDSEKVKRKVIYGVHRDRFYSVSRERIYDKFSSFGQKKTFELIVLLSFLLIVEEKINDDIILLLDDFEAGLDKTRLNKFMELTGNKRQTIITGVDNRYFTKSHLIEL